jgi:hypothetical protein
MSCPICGESYSYYPTQVTNVSYPKQNINVAPSKSQNKCDETQKKADVVCAPGPSGDLGRFNGGEALGQGLSCLTSQKQADIACKK